MSHTLGIAFLVVGLNVALASLVFLRSSANWVNRSFALFALAVAGWTASTTLANLHATDHFGLLFARSSFLMAGSSVYFLLLFFHVYPFGTGFPRSAAVRIASIAVAIIGTASISPWVVRDLAIGAKGLKITYGPLYPLFALYTLSCIGYSVVYLWTRVRAARGTEREQLYYLFLALVLPGLLATGTNLLVPLATGYSTLSQYGPFFSVAMIAMIAHAIIRHRLFNVRLVIRHGVVYLLAVAVAGTLAALSIWLFHSTALGDHPRASFAIQVALALLVGLAFGPLKQFIQSRLDRYVYRETYNYRRILASASRAIASSLEIRRLAQYLCRVTSDCLKPEFVALVVRDPRQTDFTVIASHTLATAHLGHQAIFSQTSPLPAFLARTKRLIVTEDIERTAPELNAADAASELRRLRTDVAVPMLTDTHLIGFLLVGPKLSGDAFFDDDLELLTTLAHQATIALRNAQLFGEVLLASEYVENILRTMGSAVITVDARGDGALCNAEAERLLHVSRATLGSVHLSSLPEPLSSQLSATLEDGSPRLQAEGVLLADVQHPIPIMSSTAALRDATGEIIGALAVFSDVSKLKALESEKRRAERLAAFTALVSGIGHEIKNPLVAIKTFAELLPERYQESDFRDDFAKVVITEIDRIDDLVGRLRGLAAPVVHAAGRTDIREAISDTLVLLRARLEQANVRVKRDFQDASFVVPVDAAQLKQLFLNLILNAIEAIGTDGELAITVSRKQSLTGWRIVVEVADTGPGIPDDIRSSVFNPFFTTKPRGTGLGLAICRGITDAHAGVIRTEDPRGPHGAVLVVDLPAADDDALESSVRAAEVVKSNETVDIGHL